MNQLAVCAGVVAHNPKGEGLSELVEHLRSSSNWVVVVDNNSSDKSYLSTVENLPRVTVIHNEKNCGISGGINQIIEYARGVSAKFVAAFDQDTKIPANLIEVLATDFETLLAAGEPVAAIGPLVIDDYTNYNLPFLNFKLPLNAKYRRETATPEGQLVECDFLISSGCLMSMDAIDDVGSMNEALFIDNVDLDWCFRALHKHYKVYGDFGSAIRQQIGETYTKIPFTKVVIRFHDYKRHYYMTRNRIWLYRQSYANKSWVVHDVCRFTFKFFYLLAFKGDRRVLLRSSMKAVIDSFTMKPYNADIV